MTTGATPVAGPKARSRWERAMRAAQLPGSLKLVLWTVGSYEGSKPPSTTELCADTGLSRQRLFELLGEAIEAGWLARESRPGRPSKYVCVIPESAPETTATRQMGLTGKGSESMSENPYPSDTSYGLTVANPSDGSDGSTDLHNALQKTKGHAAPATPATHNDSASSVVVDRPTATPIPEVGTWHSSPKPGPPPARAKRRRRGRAHGTSPPPLLAVVHDLPPTGTEGQP